MRKGYTLIELLVGLAILGLIFGVGYANFRDYSRRQAVVSAERDLRSDLRLAQEQALAGQKPAGCNVVLNAYKFKILSSTQYEIDANCAGGDIVVKAVTLPGTITFTSPAGPFPFVINFKVLGVGTDLPSGTSVTITLKQSQTGAIKTLIINYTGEIREQ